MGRIHYMKLNYFRNSFNPAFSNMNRILPKLIRLTEITKSIRVKLLILRIKQIPNPS